MHKNFILSPIKIRYTSSMTKTDNFAIYVERLILDFLLSICNIPKVRTSIKRKANRKISNM